MFALYKNKTIINIVLLLMYRDANNVIYVLDN